MLFRDSIVRGNAHPWSISLLMDLFSVAAFSTDWDDLWFPLSIILLKYDFLVSWIEMVTIPVLDYIDNLRFFLVME